MRHGGYWVNSLVEELKEIQRAMNSPAQLMFDLQRVELVPLTEQASIYCREISIHPSPDTHHPNFGA